jgi:regulator of sigma E protease
MLPALVFIVVLSILVVIHEFGHFVMAKGEGVKVERFSLGFGPKIFSQKRKDTEYLISAIPLGGYVKLAGDNLEEFKGKPYEYLAKTPWQRAKILLMGPALNYAAGFLCLWLVFFVGYPTLTSKVGETIDGLGAQEAGILKGDKIIAVDGIKIEYWEQMQKIIHNKKAGAVVRLTIMRDNLARNIDVAIKEQKLPGILGDKKNVGLIGIKPADDIIKIRHGLLRSFTLATEKLLDFTLITYKAIWRMLTGKLSMRESITGPLGIFYITAKTAELGFVAVVHLMAVLNVSLAIFNLLPIPVLDGGYLFLLIIEQVKGRKTSQKIDKIATQLGLSLIIVLAVFVFYNDLVKFGIFDKIVKFLNLPK